MSTVPDGVTPGRKTWVPNRKVLAGAIAGLLSLGAFVLTGAELDPAVSASITAAVVTVVSYFMPLADAGDNESTLG